MLWCCADGSLSQILLLVTALKSRSTWPWTTERSDCRTFFNRVGAGRIRHIKFKSVWVQSKVREGFVTVRKVGRTQHIRLGYETLDTREDGVSHAPLQSVWHVAVKCCWHMGFQGAMPRPWCVSNSSTPWAAGWLWVQHLWPWRLPLPSCWLWCVFWLAFCWWRHAMVLSCSSVSSAFGWTCDALTCLGNFQEDWWLVVAERDNIELCRTTPHMMKVKLKGIKTHPWEK